MLVGIAHNPGNSRKCGDFLRGALGVAAGDHDFCAWVFAMNTSDGGASILVGRGSDRAGVENNNVSGYSRIGGRKALRRKLALQGCAIRLRSPATKVLNKKFRHERYYNLSRER